MKERELPRSFTPTHWRSAVGGFPLCGAPGEVVLTSRRDEVTCLACIGELQLARKRRQSG